MTVVLSEATDLPPNSVNAFGAQARSFAALRMTRT
jgi:hypothetical protein